MNVLSVDSCSASASASIHIDSRIAGEYFLNSGLVHSKTLAPMIKSLLDSSETSVKDIDLFAVTNGPGSFTGIRIGTSIVKGMAGALGKPCVSVSSLHALAANVRHVEAVVCSCIDARQGRVYGALFDSSGEGLRRVSDDEATTASELVLKLKDYDKKIVFVGDAAETCYNIARDTINGERISPAPEALRFIKASEVGLIAAEVYLKTGGLKASEITPVYLRRPQAERELIERNLKGGELK